MLVCDFCGCSEVSAVLSSATPETTPLWRMYRLLDEQGMIVCEQCVREAQEDGDDLGDMEEIE